MAPASWMGRDPSPPPIPPGTRTPSSTAPEDGRLTSLPLLLAAATSSHLLPSPRSSSHLRLKKTTTRTPDCHGKHEPLLTSSPRNPQLSSLAKHRLKAPTFPQRTAQKRRNEHDLIQEAARHAEKLRQAASPELIRSRSSHKPLLPELSRTNSSPPTTSNPPMHPRRPPHPKPPAQAAAASTPREHGNPPRSSGDLRPRRQRGVTQGPEHRASSHSPPAAESGGATARRELQEAREETAGLELTANPRVARPPWLDRGGEWSGVAVYVGAAGPTWDPLIVNAGPTWDPRIVQVGPTWDPRIVQAGPTWDPLIVHAGPT
ncbi:hypothetical protein HU200_061029 [Digitaria exilis]|uniref:Uncharacterized protein n=1 Tax=Digitaria exilis TaxID=1010633 RepID=A0A835AIA0_9POAL|nr:hypothetical protein HU200_061029 [Digitaria exilis]